MATFEARRRLSNALGDAPAQAVTGYVEESQRELTTHADFAALRADFADVRADFADLRAGFSGLRGDMYRALWIQGGAIVMLNSAILASALALAGAFG